MAVAIEDVMSVYSGIDGRCCCGCAGKHYYASQYVDLASKDRGYQVSEDEVNDRMVKKVVRILNEKSPDEIDDLGNCLCTVVGRRLYIAYWKKIREEN